MAGRLCQGARLFVAGGRGNGLSVLRLVRIFRVVRIFNKLHNMRRILHATFAASAAMMNAFLLFVVIISIYSVMAVNLFSAHDDHPFTSFSRSFYTLLGIWQLFLSVSTRPFPSLLPFFFPPHERIHACTIPRQNIGVATGEDCVCV